MAIRTLSAVILVSTLGFVTGCSSSEPPAGASGGDPLARPLRLPTLAPGDQCPRSPGREVNPAFGEAAGLGPAYAVLGAHATLEFIYPAVEGQAWYPSEWSGQKVLWVIDPSYRGDVLIRGGRIDGPQRLGFGSGQTPEWRMTLVPVAPGAFAGGWPNFPSYTRLKAAGCYAYQVDGRDFSYSIVFLAVPLSN